jgi:hypothetical protein
VSFGCQESEDSALICFVTIKQKVWSLVGIQHEVNSAFIRPFNESAYRYLCVLTLPTSNDLIVQYLLVNLRRGACYNSAPTAMWENTPDIYHFTYIPRYLHVHVYVQSRAIKYRPCPAVLSVSDDR